MLAYSTVSLQHTLNLMTVTAQRQEAAQAALFTAALTKNSSESTASAPRTQLYGSSAGELIEQPCSSRTQKEVTVHRLVEELKEQLILRQLGAGVKSSNALLSACLPMPAECALLLRESLLKVQLATFTTAASLEQQEFLSLSLLLKLGEGLKLQLAQPSDSLLKGPLYAQLLPQAEPNPNLVIPLYYLTLSKLLTLKQLRLKRKSFKEQKKEKEQKSKQERRELMQQFNECFIG
ncbi:MAG: hypothetical protein K6F05_04660 [Succinivibrio sp.]|nr:hypothetical protein [Succinivibrio sp.]